MRSLYSKGGFRLISACGSALNRTGRYLSFDTKPGVLSRSSLMLIKGKYVCAIRTNAQGHPAIGSKIMMQFELHCLNALYVA